MKKFTKPYQLWQSADDNYYFVEYDSLEEAVLADKYGSDWYITQKVDFTINPINDVGDGQN